MSVTINASTTSGLVMTSDLSGVLTLQQNGVSLPNGGVAPAFSAYQSTLQTVSNATLTKVQLQTEEFDTASAFDSTTNYRFTPTVAGYYQVNGNVEMAITTSFVATIVYKNGSRYKDGVYASGTSIGASATVSTIVYLNGSTDYVELYCYQATALSQSTTATQYATWFNASLVRGA